MPPPTSALHSPATGERLASDTDADSDEEVLTSGTDSGTAWALVPSAASQPGTGGGGKEPAADGGGKEPEAGGGKERGAGSGKEPEVAGGKEPEVAGGKKQEVASGKKPVVPFERVWSEADEVRILEGLAAWAATHGAEPQRSQLHAALEGRGLDKPEFTVIEIYEKVRRLRSKYANLRSAGGVRVSAGGADDGNEARKYELSRSIWGDQPIVVKKGGASRATNASGNANANANAVLGTRVRRGLEELQVLYPSLALAVEGITDNKSLGPTLKRAFELISDEQASELDAKLKKQRLMEAQMTVNATVLRNKVLKKLIGSMD